MKRLFNHTRRSYEKWEGYNEEDAYDWDTPGDEEYYAGEETDEYYAEEETDGEYYEEEGVYYTEDGELVYEAEETDDEYYEETEGEYFAEEETDGEYYEETEDGYYAEEEIGDDYYEEDEMYYMDPPRRKADRISRNESPAHRKNNMFSGIWKAFGEMGVMDRIVTVTGAIVLLLALTTGIVYIGTKLNAGKMPVLADVGSQLDGITLIGEKGLLAVADAEMARQAAAEIVEEEQKEYEEEDYGSDVDVKLHMTSVMKDLKIKFTNQKTGRLIANVPFSVTVTNPGGKSETWSDDDMDGIIYKKNITPGKYSVLINELTEDKYKGYAIPTVAQSVEVKKDIAYEKIDVSDEVKTEDEIDVDKEDPQKNDTEEESKLKDTVEWVESTVVIENYKEVSKSTIPDPSTLALNRIFVPQNVTMPLFTTVSDGDLQPFTATVSPTSAIVGIGGMTEAQITATGYTEGKALKYSVVSDNSGVATAIVDASGKIMVTGVAEGTAVVTATVDYADGMSLPVQVTLPVTVLAKPTIMLDKTTATVFVAENVTITASIANATMDVPVTAESSDAGVATVAVNGKAVTVTGVAQGDATITVKYVENGEELAATCAVTVKTNPKDNKTDKLKDSTGNQLYVLEGETYREAVYADYYTAANFFIKGEAKYTGWQTIDGKVYFFTKNGEKVTGEQIIQGAKYTFASDGSLVTGSGTMGIDVSKWNGTIDWNAVKNSGVSYVIIRCGYRGSSQGMLIEDPKFTANIKGATAAGLKVGVYFFTQATDEVEAVEEASYVLDKIKNYKISYPVFLDVEYSGGRGDKIDKATRTAVCKAFCETIQRNGYTAGIYANKTWLNEKMNASALNSYKIWLAQYASTPTYTGKYDLWQYTSTGKVSGIKGDVDLNLSYLGY